MHRSVLAAAIAAAFLVGCVDEAKENSEFMTLDPAAAATTTTNPNPTTFTQPFDATLSPDGKTAYFTAVTDQGTAVLRKGVNDTGEPTVLAAGSPLVAPVGLDITSDGKTLFIADTNAGTDEGDTGQIFTISTEGGSLTAVSEAAGFNPRGMVIIDKDWADHVVFTGTDPSDGMPGVFKMPAKGGAVETVAKGAPFIDPSGVTASTENWDIYVTDTSDSGLSARVLKITKAGEVSVLLGDLRMGYPAGIALSQNQKIVIVSALDPLLQTDLVIRYDLRTGDRSDFTDVVSQFTESAGLHKAKQANSFVWADSHANGGTVFVINKVQ